MKRKFLFGKNWFFEEMKFDESPTFAWGVIPEKEIFAGKSQFQKIEVFDTKEFGRILALDEFVQLSTKQEFVYHEMLVQPAMFYHWAAGGGAPERILIVGGGDGGALREVVRHKSAKEIFLVDLDKKVIAVSKKYLPSVSQGAFKNKRLRVFHEDALKFVKKYNNSFDIIINDLTDPKGPSSGLWSAGFYRDVLRALKENGVAAFQTAFLKEKFGQKARKRIKRTFPFFKVHKAFVRCFPFDEHTFSFGSKKINFDRVSFRKIKEKYKELNIKTRYYFPEIHFSSAILPKSS